jgi:hypothetical protein
MTLKKWMVAPMVVLASTAALLAVPAQAATNISIQIAPPPLQAEVLPAPRRGQVWVPGHWRWSGNQHIWVAGHWQSRRTGMVYAPARWVQIDGRWHYREAAWVRAGAAGYRDTDGDGVVDRFDRDRDNDGIPNRADAQPNRPNAIYTEVAPPPPRVERFERRQGRVWVPGHWRWTGGQYTWIEGHYQARRAGMVFAPARWVRVGNRWEYREGAWVRPGLSYRDTDGDGIVDRYDRDRDNDGVPNARDSNPGSANRN